MTFAFIIIIILAILALVGTIFVAKDKDENYMKKTKNNLTRLTWIYTIVIILAIIAVAVYISLK
ncbi:MULTISPECIES: hypothetical protein [Metabacillus]|jgi:preprotein translocase subunit SecG|uniref:Uncharacterized protein n=1 Tax=Metabacillus rhizolycopersici TaxID=2875709 RepID=A0ABS7USP6_9BACI|nr:MULTISPECIES: hypothetical protein [Metabacillus]MBZ5751023.1 hypothetical protein [Metabacillus rhizolycopersici]MCM3652488.1 hypothetical protein [Metabacillus litoralis]